jgi:hypothetical protein
VPPSDLLALLNIKYVMTDKTQDVWIDDVFYDLEHTMPLGSVSLGDLPQFPTTHIGVVSYLTGTAIIPDNTMVAQVVVTDTAGASLTLPLLAGEDTAEGLYSERSGHRQARVGHLWRDNVQGSDYVTVIQLEAPLVPQAIGIHSSLPGNQVVLRGLTLIDNASGNSRSIPVDPTYSLVHSGDIKIYQNHSVLPRAFIVNHATVVTDEAASLRAMQDPTFDSSRSVILSSGYELDAGQGESDVAIRSYGPQRIELDASLSTPGYLVLTDTFYPGWTAEVDGKPTTIQKADLYFRAVALEPGEHRITFRYQPKPTQVALTIGGLAWLLWGLILAIMVYRIGRKSPSGV